MASLRRALLDLRQIVNSKAMSNQSSTFTTLVRSETSDRLRDVFNLLRIVNSLPMTNQSSIVTVPVRSEAFYRSHLSSLSRFCSDAQSYDINLSNEERKRRIFNRLLYRSKQRGYLELDLVLGNWVEDHITSMDENGIRALVDVLDLENPDLWKWLTSQEQPPEAVNTNPVFSAVRNKVMNNLNSHSAPETRAKPGQPWVRGWADVKKGRDSPITGESVTLPPPTFK